MSHFKFGFSFFLLWLCIAHAETGYYVKLGGGSMPGGKPSMLLSVGGRYKMENHALDVSLNGQTFYAIFVLDHLITTKVQYLYYPFSNSGHAMYFGGGGGFGISRHTAAIPSTLGGGGSSSSTRFLTVDSVIGWQFWLDQKIKPFLQLEISQPVVYFKGNHHGRWTPAVAICTGLGW
jgi:hypothetical protein